MPVVGNRFYNDPNIGAGFANLAQLFAPPSAQDTAAYATANARRAEARALEEEAQRKQAQFDWLANPANQSDPAYQNRAEGYWLGNGGRPDQGFGMTMRGQDLGLAAERYKAEQDAAARRYGSDQSLAGVRYGADRDFAASTANNAADNAQKMAAEKLKGVAGFYGTVTEGAIRPAVPRTVTELFDLPTDLPQVDGRQRPLSESEVKGAERERLYREGKLPDQVLLDAITGEKSPVEAIDPATGRPIYMSPGAAVRQGAQPAPKTPAVSVNTASGEGAFDKTLGENQAKLFLELSAEGAPARDDLALLNRLDEQMQNLPGGFIGGLQSFASNFGIKIGENASNVEAADALISRLVPSARQGLPGAASDRDVALFRASLPKLSQTKEGAAVITDTLRGLAQARIALARIGTAVVNREMSRPEGMNAIQNMPDPFLRLRAATEAMGSGPAPLQPSVGPGPGPGPSAMPSAAPVYATNPQTGERLMLRDGKWEPAQ